MCYFQVCASAACTIVARLWCYSRQTVRTVQIDFRVCRPGKTEEWVPKVGKLSPEYSMQKILYCERKSWILRIYWMYVPRVSPPPHGVGKQCLSVCSLL